ncbi:hypothetical protein ACWDAO_30170 [Streptomyces sp. NPDC001212]
MSAVDFLRSVVTGSSYGAGTRETNRLSPDSAAFASRRDHTSLGALVPGGDGRGADGWAIAHYQVSLLPEEPAAER